MRRVLLTVLSVSLASAALAEPTPRSALSAVSDHQAKVEEQAARIRAYRKAMEAERKAAPEGLKEMIVYVQPDGSPVPTPAETLQHRVVKGDTLYGISRKYGVGIDALKSANAIEGSAIQLGQSLIIPTVKQASASKTTRIVEPVTPSDDITSVSASEKPEHYAVAPRDTLYAIAKRTCTTTGALISINDLTAPDQLKPGQMLSLPDNHCLER
ncbi:MAG: LysM peptidoglycan-binding domain-containing protein [Pseudomonadota bacterium]